MPCYKPLMALVRKPPPGVPGKAKITFPKTMPSADVARHGTPTPLPCGQCIGCRLERSRQWATRLMKELRLHDRSSFLTLTYSDDALPRLPNGTPTLYLRDVQLFLKSLRKHLAPNRIRFFQCGEYGETTHRPHYHMILFGEDFSNDRERIQDSRSGYPQYSSPTLNRLWNNGRCTISEVSFESSAYVARYCLKKITGKGSALLYAGRKPEFVTMSRNPGIAHQFFTDYQSDIYPHDEVVPGIGRPPSLPPKYFDRLLERVDPTLYSQIKENRSKELDFYNDPNSTDTRLATRERVKLATIKNTLKRTIE